jgi:MFS superfamily sulfate permease-like transporter
MDTWQADMKAGFLVSLIALPLCFGIATASGFPPIAGIISAIVGGLLISHINGVPLGITGPAAGLITVLFSAVQTLGQGDHWAGYRYTLAAVVISGGLQILLGLSRTSRIAALFPAAIAHGMLAAIGISIIARQAHILLGTRPEADTVWQSLT